MIPGRAYVLVCLLASALLAPMMGAGAQDERSRPKLPTAPLPPTRPSKLGAPADVAPHAATTPTPTPRRTVAIVQPPHDLPVATRARMHECGAQWQDMKMAGTAADKTWRVFAQSCLVSQTP